MRLFLCEKPSQARDIAAVLGKASEVVIATDPDREGEVIAREVLDQSLTLITHP